MVVLSLQFLTHSSSIMLEAYLLFLYTPKPNYNLLLCIPGTQTSTAANQQNQMVIHPGILKEFKDEIVE